MDISDQSTPAKPTWRARISSAWKTLRTNAAEWWTETGRGATSVSAAIVVFFLAVVLVGRAIDWNAERRQAPAVAAPAVEASPGLQDQVDALRLRVIVLEARADAQPKSAAAPRASVPRTIAARAGTESPVATTGHPLATTPAKRWGTTDLDREIAAFPSTPSLEQAK